MTEKNVYTSEISLLSFSTRVNFFSFFILFSFSKRGHKQYTSLGQQILQLTTKLGLPAQHCLQVDHIYIYTQC